MPGSYSVNISTERTVTSLRHEGARSEAVSVNHWNESAVGNAAATIGFSGEGDVLIAATRAAFEADRAARYTGADPAMLPVVDENPLAPSALPTPDSWQWFTETGRSRAPSWRNEVTLRSVELFTEYEPGTYLPWISPTPLLMVVAREDHLTPADLAIAAFERAHEPKKLVVLPGGHFDAYVKGFDGASAAARDWLVEHLMG